MLSQRGCRSRIWAVLIIFTLIFNMAMCLSAFEVSAESPVLIGQATCNEKGGVKGGKAGDQTGREVAISNWNCSRTKGAFNSWEYVFRANSSKTAKKLARKMKQTCANNCVGYDQKQPDRFSFHDEALKDGWDITKI